jgi:hypothetical protein
MSGEHPDRVDECPDGHADQQVPNPPGGGDQGGGELREYDADDCQT